MSSLRSSDFNLMGKQVTKKKEKISQSMLEVLEQISFGARSQKPLKDIFDSILPLVAQLFRTNSIVIWRANKEGDRLQLEATFNVKPGFITFFEKEEHWPRAGEGVIGLALKEQRI